MGVLNVTPDSFSDGGELPTSQALLIRAENLLLEGADILDLGGESTRPDAEPVDSITELSRVLPALLALRKRFPEAPISIETYKPDVADAAIRSGADIVNDIWGATIGLNAEVRDIWIAENCAGPSAKNAPPKMSAEKKPLHPRSPMAETVAKLGCPIILMHNRPNREYAGFLTDVLNDLRFSLALAAESGVPKHQIWLDPGFGFAKNAAENLEVLKNLHQIVALGYPVLLGTSRKSTLGKVLGNAPANDRLEGTAATTVWGIQQGAAMVRLHDIPRLRRFITMADAIKAGLAWKDEG